MISNNESWFEVEVEGTFICRTKILISADSLSEAEDKVLAIIISGDDEIKEYPWELSFDSEDFQPEDIAIIGTKINEELSNWHLRPKVQERMTSPLPPPRPRGVAMGASGMYTEAPPPREEYQGRKKRRR